MKNRTVSWFEGKISEVLFQNTTITTDYELSTLVLRDTSTIDEDYNYEIAIMNLISCRIVKRCKNENSITTYSLAA